MTALQHPSFRLALGGLLPVVIIGGFWLPYLSFMAPLVMLSGLAISARKGRWVCGNACPRGAFFDRIMQRFGRHKKLPPLLKKTATRWSVVLFLMSFMTYRLIPNVASLDHWAHVFWQMCVITSAFGIALALLYFPRAWCSLCPMGTMQAKIGGKKQPIQFEGSACKMCGKCEKSCPMNLPIIDHKERGQLENPDCIKCGKCITACPLSLLKKAT